MQSHLFRLAPTLIAILTATSAQGAEDYICASDHVAGFAFDRDTKQWRATSFRADEKFLIKSSPKEDRAQGIYFTVTKTGSSRPDFVCERDFGTYGSLTCGGFGQFKFNKRTLRFMSTYTIGYTDEGLGIGNLNMQEGSNTPAMSIGRCTPL